MATTKFYLDLRGKAKDGKGSILITLFHNSTTTSLSTGIRVAPSDWDGTRIIRISGRDALNARLEKMKSDIDRKLAILSFEDGFMYKTASELKHLISSKVQPGMHTHLLEDLFTDYMKSDLKESTQLIYRTTLKKIDSCFGRGSVIEDVDYKWINQFQRYLAQTQGINGRAIYLRALKAVCNYARHLKIIPEFPFENFTIKQEATRKRGIFVEELRAFLNHPVTEHQAMFRDYFFLMFYLIGINPIDLLHAPKTAIYDGRFEYSRSKTGKKYSIKIEPEAAALIEKYSGKKYLLDALDKYTTYKNFVHNMNHTLKEIGAVHWEMIPDGDNLFAPPKLVRTVTSAVPGVSSGYARHSWVTIACEIGISMDVISQAMGHSTAYKTTFIYLKFDRQKIDDANRKVIDALLNPDA